MAGLYIHIPFCKSRCIYCGFYSTTVLPRRREYVQALCRELMLRRDDLHGAPIETIYFGGGTPSLLTADDFGLIFDTIYNIYNVRAKEVTVECNPDDVTAGIARLRLLGVNRLSLGLQTFNDERLRFLRRRHTARQATIAVRTAQEAGFDNISIDLMFGFPGQTLQEWQDDLRQALALHVQHLSAYTLMYEEGTPLEQMLSAGKVSELEDEASLSMYDALLDITAASGFGHYEISNFALPGRESLHNSAYWNGTPYLGVGAGAHSFDGKSRHYNPDSLELYLKSLKQDTLPLQSETLTTSQRYNECVFTALRTSRGLDLRLLSERFGEPYHDYCLRNASPHIHGGRLTLEANRLRLTRQGLFTSNDIMSDLMWVD